MAECTNRVGKGTITFKCMLPQGHRGPCASRESAPSQAERARWEQAEATRSHQESGLGEFQGEPQTTAQRYTDGATPPPGTAPVVPTVMGDRLPPPPRQVWLDGAWWTEVIGNQTQPPPGEIWVEQGTERRSVPDPGRQSDRETAPNLADLDTPDPRVMAGEPIDQGEGDRRYVASDDQFAKKHDRPEDQPMPIPNDRPTAHAMLIEMIEGRLDLGIKRYGTGLQPFNGRDAALDALEEMVDAGVYLITFRTEKAEILALARQVQEFVDMAAHDESGVPGAIARIVEWLSI